MRRIALLTALAVVATAGSAAAQSDFRSCLAGLRSTVGAGISAQTWTSATQSLEPDMKVLDFLNDQPEFKTPIWDYLAALVDEERVADGKAMLRQWSSALATAESRYGVDRHTIVAVWGVESDLSLIHI